MAQQNWTLTHNPSMSIRWILHGYTLPLCRKHQRDCTLPHLQPAATDTVCHTAPSIQDQKGSLKTHPELAGGEPCLSFLPGSIITASFIQFHNIKRRCPEPENPSVEVDTPHDYTRLHDKHDSQGEETHSLLFTQLVEIPWRSKPNLLIKHCKTNPSSHRSTYARNNQRGVFQQPKKDKCLSSSLCRAEERDLRAQQSPSFTHTGLNVLPSSLGLSLCPGSCKIVRKGSDCFVL